MLRLTFSLRFTLTNVLYLYFKNSLKRVREIFEGKKVYRTKVICTAKSTRFVFAIKSLTFYCAFSKLSIV